MNASVDQKELLVARNQRGYQEICSGLYQVLTEQSPTSKETRRTTSTQNITRTIAGNQY